MSSYSGLSSPERVGILDPEDEGNWERTKKSTPTKLILYTVELGYHERGWIFCVVINGCFYDVVV
jgi:hypothetical protein